MGANSNNDLADINNAQFQLVHGGSEYFTTLANLVKNAHESVYLLVYIFEEDETGTLVADALLEAAKRGVKVKVLVDAFGSKDLSEPFILRLRDGGVQIRKFAPYFLTKLYTLGRRMHIKLCVTDKEQALIGGINISNNYNSNAGEAWLDYAVLIRDEVSQELANIADKIFDKKWTGFKLAQYKLGNKYLEILVNDWFNRLLNITNSFNKLIQISEQEIVIMVSYFFPSRGQLKRLSKASARGVKIILINSVKWDIPFMKRAIRYLYPRCRKNNIDVYELKTTVLHAKIMFVDGKLCTIGSYNLNSLSRFNSLELNVNITEPNFVRQFYNEVMDIKSDSSKMIRIDDYQPGWISYFFNWLSYQIIWLGLGIMFLFRGERKGR